MVLDTRSIGITLETHNKDNGEVSEKIDWGLIFMMLKNRGFTHNEILKLSYPQFNAYMNNIYNSLSYNIVIPYLGSGEEKEQGNDVSRVSKENGREFNSEEELLATIAMMNSEFGS